VEVTAFLEKLGDQRQIGRQRTVLIWGLTLCVSLLAFGQTKDRLSGQAREGKNAKADSTTQSALSPAPLSDSSAHDVALHAVSTGDADQHDETPPEWMRALNGPDHKDSNSGDNSRDPFHISELINNHNHEIKAIYRQFLKRWPDLEGKLTVRIHLAPCGTVTKVKVVESTINQRPFEKAVLDAIRRWQDFGAHNSKTEKIYRQQYIFGE
jgi:TonB family protein